MSKVNNVQANFIRSKADQTSFTVPAVLSTETPVKRSGYIEILKHDQNSVDLTRFPLPVIVGHDDSEVNIGVAENPKISGGKLRAVIRFGSSAKAQEIFNDVQSGIVTGLSVGYQIMNYVDTVSNGENIMTVTRFKPYETSIVAIPADQNAGFFRNQNMNTETQTKSKTQPVGGGDELFDIDFNDPNAQRAIQYERDRVKEIRDFARFAGERIKPEMVDEFIKRGLSYADAKEKILEIWSKQADAETVRTDASVWSEQSEYSGYGVEHVRNAMVDGLILRSGLKLTKPHKAAQDFRHMSLHEVSRMLLREKGIHVSDSSPSSIIKRAMSTSDLPFLLEAIANKSLMVGFEEAPQTHDKFCNFTEVSDFKAQNRIALSYFESLQLTPELGEVNYSYLDDSKESYQISTYQRGIKFSRQMLINDDLSELTQVSNKLGSAARRTEADLVYNIFLNNPNMADTKPIFDDTRGNLLTGAPSVLSSTSLSNAVMVLRKAKDISERGFLGLSPRFLIIPPELEYTADALLASLRNPYGNIAAVPDSDMSKIEIIVEPRLTNATAWYLLASGVETIEVGRLAGNGISFESETTFDTDALKMKVRLDAGAKCLSAKGMIKSNGV